MRRQLTLLLVLAAASPAIAQVSPAQWALKLGSPNYAEREKAARMLEQLGSAAMPALRERMKTSDLETKRRAILVMERIEDRMMIEEITTATPVRFRFKDAALPDALREVEKRTGLATGKVETTRRLTDFDSGMLPYWQAWRKFCAAAELQESDYARSPARLKRLDDDDVKALASIDVDIGNAPRPGFANFMRFTPAQAADGYAEDARYSVRVRVKWLELDRSLDKKVAHAVFAVEVRAEPRLEIVKAPRAEITRLIDPNGMARAVRALKLIPENSGPEQAAGLAAYAGEIQFGGLLQLKPLAWQGPPATLKELRGVIRMDVMARPRILEVPNVARAEGKELRTFDGIALKILEADAEEEGEILLRLRLDNLGSLAPQTPEQKIVRVRPGVVAERGEIDVALERLELRDASGRKCALLRSRYERAEMGKGYDVELAYSHRGTKDAELTLALTKAPRTIPVEIPFLVRDVAWNGKGDAK